MSHNVFIHIPAFGHIVSTATLLTSHSLRDAFHSKGIGSVISSLSFPDIAELRNMVMTIWYDTMPNSDWLLFFDADMGFPAELPLDMLVFNEPVMGCLYRHRRDPVTWVGSGLGSPMTQRRGGFMEVEGTGGGCFMIRRDAVTRMLQLMPHLVDNRIKLHPAFDTLSQAGAQRMIRAFEKLDIPERGLISEDLSFCIRWRQCGGQIWAHMGHRISHVGPYDFAGRYLDLIEQQAAVGQLAPPKEIPIVYRAVDLPWNPPAEAPAEVAEKVELAGGLAAFVEKIVPGTFPEAEAAE